MRTITVRTTTNLMNKLDMIVDITPITRSELVNNILTKECEERWFTKRCIKDRLKKLEIQRVNVEKKIQTLRKI